jgi:hypothetical protein
VNKPQYTKLADPSLRIAALRRWNYELKKYYAYQYANQDHECELIRKTPNKELPLLIGNITTEKAIQYLQYRLEKEGVNAELSFHS